MQGSLMHQSAGQHATCVRGRSTTPLCTASLQQRRTSTAVSARASLKQQRSRHQPAIRCTAAADASADASAPATLQRPKAVPDGWQKLLDVHAAKETVTGNITGVNKGGVLVDVNGIEGFIPFSRLDPARMASRAAEAESSTSMSLDPDHRDSLVGSPVTAKIISVNVPDRQLVLSERAANMAALVTSLKKGDEIDGVITRLMDFGAFVSLRNKDGDLRGTEGLIHKSELSWDRILRPEEVVHVGDDVRAKVLSIDTKKNRVNLSLKRMQDDPLQETLDGLLPLLDAGDEPAATVPVNVPQSIGEVVGELAKEEGITNISLGRQVEEKRTVAQDLELYISKKKVENGYALVGRAGRVVQEISIETDLNPAGLKAAMQRALKRLV